MSEFDWLDEIVPPVKSPPVAPPPLGEQGDYSNEAILGAVKGLRAPSPVVAVAGASEPYRKAREADEKIEDAASNLVVPVPGVGPIKPFDNPVGSKMLGISMRVKSAAKAMMEQYDPDLSLTRGLAGRAISVLSATEYGIASGMIDVARAIKNDHPELVAGQGDTRAAPYSGVGRVLGRSGAAFLRGLTGEPGDRPTMVDAALESGVPKVAAIPIGVAASFYVPAGVPAKFLSATKLGRLAEVYSSAKREAESVGKTFDVFALDTSVMSKSQRADIEAIRRAISKGENLNVADTLAEQVRRGHKKVVQFALNPKAVSAKTDSGKARTIRIDPRTGREATEQDFRRVGLVSEGPMRSDDIVEHLVPSPTLPMTPERISEWQSFRKEAEAMVDRIFPVATTRTTRETWTPIIDWQASGFGVLPDRLGRKVESWIVDHASAAGRSVREFDPEDVSVVGRARKGIARGIDHVGRLFNTRHIPLDSNGKLVPPSQARALFEEFSAASNQLAHSQLEIDEAAVGLSKSVNYEHKVFGPAIKKMDEEGNTRGFFYNFMRWLSDKQISDEVARDLVDLAENGLKSLPMHPKDVDYWLRQGLKLVDDSDSYVDEALARVSFKEDPDNWKAQIVKLESQINRVDAKLAEMHRLHDIAEATDNIDAVRQAEERIRDLTRGRIMMDHAYWKMAGKKFDPDDIITRQAGPVSFDPDIDYYRVVDGEEIAESRITREAAERERSATVSELESKLVDVRNKRARLEAAQQAVIRSVGNAVDVGNINKIKDRLGWLNERMRAIVSEQATVEKKLDTFRIKNKNASEIDRAVSDFDKMYEARVKDELASAMRAAESSPYMNEPAARIPGYRRRLNEIKESDPEGYEKAINKTTVGDWIKATSTGDESYVRRMLSYIDYRSAKDAETAAAKAAAGEPELAKLAIRRARAWDQAAKETARRRPVSPLRPPRVPLASNGLPVPAKAPVSSVAASHGAEAPPSYDDLLRAAKTPGKSVSDTMIQGFQDAAGKIVDPNGRREWVRGLIAKHPDLIEPLSKEILDEIGTASRESVSKVRGFQLAMTSRLLNYTSRVREMGSIGEFVTHSGQKTAKWKMLLGNDVMAQVAPGTTKKRKLRDTMYNLSEALETVGFKSRWDDRNLVKSFIDYSRTGSTFEASAALVDRVVGRMGIEANELLARMSAAKVRAPKTTSGLRNFYASSFVLEQVGGSREQVGFLRKIEDALNSYGIAAGSDLSSGTGKYGIGRRLAEMARKGTGGRLPVKIDEKSGNVLVDLSPELLENFKSIAAAKVAKMARSSEKTAAAKALSTGELVSVAEDGRTIIHHLPKDIVSETASSISEKISVLEKKRQELAPGVAFVVNKFHLGRAMRDLEIDDQSRQHIWTMLGALDDKSSVSGKYYLKVEGDAVEDVMKALEPVGGTVFAIPDGVERMMNGHFSSLMSFNESFSGLLGFLHRNNAIYKALQTVWRPSYHVRNGISNAYTIHNIAGVRDPAIWVTSTDILAGKSGGFTGLSGRTYRYQDVMDLARRHGLVGSDFNTDITRELFGSKAEQVLSKLTPQAAGRAVGSGIETHAKIALFSHYLREGLSPFDSAVAVKKYLFDYQDLTDWERKFMRLAAPFYTFTRKNLPLQVEAIIKNPSLVLTPERIRRALSAVQNGREMEPGEREVLPSWMIGRQPVLYKDRNGRERITPVVGYMNTTSDLEQLMGRGVVPYTAEMANPIFMGAMSQVFNRDLRTGFEITDAEYETPWQGLGDLMRPETDVTSFMGIVVGRRKAALLRMMAPLTFYDNLVSGKYVGPYEVTKFVLGLSSYDADFPDWKSRAERSIDRQILRIERDAENMAERKGGLSEADVKLITSRIREKYKKLERIYQN